MILGAVVTGLLLSAGANAATFCHRPQDLNEVRKDRGALSRLLKGRDIETLESFAGGLIDSYEGGKRSDAEVDQWFIVFDREDPAITPVLREWISRYPRSYAAHLAYARHMFSVASAKRGGKFADKTSPEQFRAMEVDFHEAMKALAAAEGLTPRPTLSYSLRIGVARSVASHAVVRELLAAAEKIDPLNSHVKWHYIHASSPKWGGSLEAIEDFRQSVLRSDAPQDLKDLVDFAALVTVADHLWISKPDSGRDEAVALYERASRTCEAFVDGTSRVVQFHVDKKDWGLALAALDRHIARAPLDGWGYVRRGWVRRQAGDFTGAVSDYQRAADYGERSGIEGLAWHYAEGKGIAKDLRRALELYSTAASRGSGSARKHAERIRQGLDQ